MKPRNQVKKFDQFFLATIGLITVVKEYSRMEGLLAEYESSYEGSGPFHSFFYISPPSMCPAFAKPWIFYEKS